jgi:succinoglycan biosynthesis protein ExoA
MHSGGVETIMINDRIAVLPEVSVIIPVLNEERYIAGCLRAVAAQDYPAHKMEIIVVDGMSTDRTSEIVRGFAERDHRIRLLPSPKRRTPFSMNIGVAAATGEVVVRVDGHSVIGSDHVRRCVEFLLQSGADHVGGLMRQQGNTFLAKAIALALSSPAGVGNARFRYTDREQDIDTVPFGAYRRETILRLGGFDEAFPIGQDSEFDYRITLSGGRVRITPHIWTDYFCRDSPRALARQFYRYGRAKAHILHKHGGLPSPRALAPATLLTALLSLTAAAPFSRIARRMLAGALAGYTVLCVAAAAVIGARRGWRYAPLLPTIFAVLHFSHGAGFLSALPRFLTPRPADRLYGSLRGSLHVPVPTSDDREHAPLEAVS